MKHSVLSPQSPARRRYGFSKFSRLVPISFILALLVGISSAYAQCALFSEDFNTAGGPPLSPTNVNGAWYPDRYRPAAFISDAGRLKISINGTADGATARPNGQQGVFYNTQGRKFNLPGKGVKVAKADLYIPADWATKKRRSDLWITGLDATELVQNAKFPIIGFRNVTGSSPNISLWDVVGGAWIQLGPPAAYDAWYTLEMRLVGNDLQYFINGILVNTQPSGGIIYFDNVILQAYNFNDAALGASHDPSSDNSYDAFWDNFSTQALASPTVTPGPNKSVVFTPTPGSNCTNISAQGNGGSGTYTYNWTSSNPAELPFTGQNPLVCPTVTTTYTVTASDGNCTSAPAQVTVTVKDVRCGPNNQNVSMCYYGLTICVPQSYVARYKSIGATVGACGSSPVRIGVEEEPIQAPFELTVKGYPNPTRGALTVEVMSKVAGPMQMQVLDLTGRSIQQRTEQLLEGMNEVKFDLTSQPSGTYLIRAVDALQRQGVVRVQKQ